MAFHCSRGKTVLSHRDHVLPGSVEHLVGGVGIDVDVELRVWRDIPGFLEGATHHDQPVDELHQLGPNVERDREIRQRPQRHQHECTWMRRG